MKQTFFNGYQADRKTWEQSYKGQQAIKNGVTYDDVLQQQEAITRDLQRLSKHE